MYANAYIDGMNAISVTELRKTLASVIDRVTLDHDYTIITREGGKPAAVLMSLEDFASWQETDYLLRNPANADRLRQAVAELDAGGGQVRDLVE
jgi:antitoxin YefM